MKEVFNVLESLAVIVAAGVAVYGISSWRREMRGRKEYELAEEVLALFYEACDKISVIRNPLGWQGEGETRKSRESETPEEKECLDQAYVVFERYQQNQEVFNKLHSLRYRFMALFGRDKAEPFDELRRILNEIFTSAQMLGRLWYRVQNRRLPPEQDKKIIRMIEKHEAVFWSGPDETDPIRPRLEKTVADIESICSEIIGNPNRGIRFIKRCLIRGLSRLTKSRAHSPNTR